MKPFLRSLPFVLALLWMAYCLLDFWQYQSLYRSAIQQFSFLPLALTGLGFSLFLAFVGTRYRKRVKPYVNGLLLIAISLVWLTLTVQAFVRANTDAALPPHQLIQFLGANLWTAGRIFLIFLLAYAAGDWLLSLTQLGPGKGRYTLLRVGLGIAFLTLMLFVLGAFQVLYPPVTWGLLLLFAVLNYRRFLLGLALALWKPLRRFSDLNMVGMTAFLFLLWWVNLNLVFINRPFPLGFDAMTLYVNLSSLIQDYHGLVAGNGFYNWSLFTALGYLLFQSTEVTLSLSFGGGVLALMALFAIGRRWVDPNLAMLITLLFYAMPMVNWLSVKDVKVDMSLLFFLLLILQLFQEWIARTTARPEEDPPKKNKKKRKKTSTLRRRILRQLDQPAPSARLLQQFLRKRLPGSVQGYSHLILIGLLTGFAIGVKLTAILWLMVICSGLLYHHGGYPAFLATAALATGFSLLAGLDSVAGLRFYNLSAGWLRWVLLFGGGGLLLYWALVRDQATMRGIQQSLVVVGISLLMVVPWMAKNLSESEGLNRKALLEGEPARPEINVREIERIYQEIE